VLPKIEVVGRSVLGNAVGAFAASNNTIYLSANLVESGSLATLVGVLIEEVGHWVDSLVNVADSAGDEGHIFAELVLGNVLTAAQLAGLRAENDHGVMMIDGVGVATALIQEH
jgi:hypothetical protein